MNSTDVGPACKGFSDLINAVPASLQNNDFCVVADDDRLTLLHDRINENDFNACGRRFRFFALGNNLFHLLRCSFLDRCHRRFARQLTHRWWHISCRVAVMVQQFRTRRCHSSIKHDARLQRQTRV